jgi:hypothetical protein
MRTGECDFARKLKSFDRRVYQGHLCEVVWVGQYNAHLYVYMFNLGLYTDMYVNYVTRLEPL